MNTSRANQIPIIEVKDLGKCYRIFSRPLDRVKQIFFSKRFYREYWALKNIGFEIYKGETVGIIGKNGSGKSTLLQMITGVLTPTEGDIKVRGRISALLELGAGFNPEFSGRENVYLSGQLMGLSHTEIEKKFDAILGFSEIEKFIDQPVRTYSSGMYVRLAFSIAINLDPEILIVDEALAVGDMLFQAKCMTKMREMIKNGTTILFVSHDIGTVKGLCSKCLYIKAGHQVAYGSAGSITDMYIVDSHMELNTVHAESEGVVGVGEHTSLGEGVDKVFVNTIKTRSGFAPGYNEYGNQDAELLDLGLFSNDYKRVDVIEVGAPFVIQGTIKFNRDLPSFALGYSFRDLKGQMLVGKMTTNESIDVPAVKKDDIYAFEIRGENPLKDGIYSISIGLELPIEPNIQHVFLSVIENAIVFRSSYPSDISKRMHAMVNVPVAFSYRSLSGKIKEA